MLRIKLPAGYTLTIKRESEHIRKYDGPRINATQASEEADAVTQSDYFTEIKRKQAQLKAAFDV